VRITPTTIYPNIVGEVNDYRLKYIVSGMLQYITQKLTNQLWPVPNPLPHHQSET
jgi:hypothetical protein